MDGRLMATLMMCRGTVKGPRARCALALKQELARVYGCDGPQTNGLRWVHGVRWTPNSDDELSSDDELALKWSHRHMRTRTDPRGSFPEVPNCPAGLLPSPRLGCSSIGKSLRRAECGFTNFVESILSIMLPG
eukprot:4773691-Karenia_brevis.AAC.1